MLKKDDEIQITSLDEVEVQIVNPSNFENVEPGQQLNFKAKNIWPVYFLTNKHNNADSPC